MAIDVTADPIVLTFDIYVTLSKWPPTERNFALDQTFDCRAEDAIPEILVSLEGEWFRKCIVADPIVITLTQLGSLPGSTTGFIVAADPIEITVILKAAHSYIQTYTEALKSNWIRWSDVGHLNFTINRSNVAGERRTDWAGWIYDIKKLGDKVIVYGENGVSILTPSGNTYGLSTVHRIGLKSKQAVTGNDSTHFFIDNKGQLYSLSDSLQKLDYSEYLSVMSSPVMSYDTENELIYICDGTYGYVYSVGDKSLGKGPINLTGISSQGGTLYAVAPATIATPTFEICTDIYDLGTRNFKTVYSIEVGTDLTEYLQASVDFRVSNKGSFTTLGWHLVNPSGVAYIPCYGVEFRFRLKALSYEYFEIDYLTINGFINDYSHTKHGFTYTKKDSL